MAYSSLAFRAEYLNVHFAPYVSKSRVFIVPQDIDEEAISIIDESFKTLSCSAAAFEMLLKFKHIPSREAINSHLMRKFDDVLVHFCKEVLFGEGPKQDRSLCGDCPFNSVTHNANQHRSKTWYNDI